MKDRNILIATVALVFLVSARSAEPENGDWFNGNAYQYDAELDLDYDLPPLADRKFDYIRDEERQHEEVLEQITGASSYEPTPDPGAKALTEEATDDEPPFYGWHFDRTPSGLARDYGWYNDDSQRQRRSAGTISEGRNVQQTVTGKIQSIRPIRLTNSEGATAEHTILNLQFQDGRSVLVNLGPQVDPDERNLKSGSTVVMSGSTGKIQNRRVLFAREVKVNQKIPADSESANADLSPTAQIRGVVEDYQRLFLYPSGQSKPLLRVRFEDGRTALIDLGPETSWFDLDLEEDATIAVHGWPEMIDRQRVIRAKTISVNGDTMVLR